MEPKLYDEPRHYLIPEKFTALNGAIQRIKLTVRNKQLLANPKDLLLVLDVLRSNGAQPVITKVEENGLTFTVEQPWCFGARDGRQVSDTTTVDQEAGKDTREKLVEEDIKNLFKMAHMEADFVSATVETTIEPAL